MADYYDALGVSKNASDKDIRQAFRRLARRHHPDLNPGDRDSERSFKAANEAYEVLSDPEKRRKYDRYGEQWKHADQIEARFGRGAGSPADWGFGREGADQGSDLFGGLDDLLDSFGRRGGRGGASAAGRRRIEAPVDISLQEAFEGARRNVTIPMGNRERRIEVTIPPGVDTGSVVRISLDADIELLMNVTVAPNSRFERRGDDLYTDANIPFQDALLGGETEVRTLRGMVRLKVRPNSQNGQKVRLAGQGMPRLGEAKARGDLYATIRPTLPKDLTDEERELLEKFRRLRAERR